MSVDYMKKEEPILVAIQCFVYNHEPYLRECLDGFVMQKTNFRFVAIVHDDCSTDSSAAIIREYEEKYPEIIKPIYETENQYSKHDGSLTRIMDEAVDATGTKYLACCEGDDYWIDPYKLQKQVDFLESHSEIGLCYTDYNMYDENSKSLRKAIFKNGGHRSQNFQDHLLSKGYIGPMTWMRRRETRNIGIINEDSDGSFALALEFFANSKVAYLDEVTATYRVHGNSASRPNTMEKKWSYEYGVMQTQLKYAQKFGNESLVEKVYLNNYLIDVLPLAIKLGKSEFIEEAKTFLNDIGININEQIELIETYQDIENKYNKIRASQAYKIGTMLFTPYQMMRSFLRKIWAKK